MLATMNDLLPLLLAQVERAPQQMSLMRWFFFSLGFFYSAVLLLAGTALFVGAIVVVALARRPGVIAAYLAFVPIPLLIGIWGCVDGIIQSWTVIANSTTTPSPSEVAAGYSTALVSVLAGLLAIVPGYLVTAVGLFVRTVLWRPPHEALPLK